MVSVRASKVKGSQLEYDVWYSLKPIYPEVRLTKQLGFQMQYDVETADTAIECKRLKGISWNQLVKFHKKLCSVSGKSNNFVVFKSNHQPALVFYENSFGRYEIRAFDDYFGVPFQKHPSTRVKVKK